MATGGGVASKEGLRYAEYLPPSTQRRDADIDHAAGRRLIAVGLGVAAVAFAGRYAFQIWKPLEQVITEAAKKISSPVQAPPGRGQDFDFGLKWSELRLLSSPESGTFNPEEGSGQRRTCFLHHLIEDKQIPAHQ